MEPLLQRVNTYVRRWVGNKFRKLRTYTAVRAWWARLVERDPRLFVQWRWVRSWPELATGERSPVTGDCHAGICGSRGVRFPPATRLALTTMRLASW